VISQDYAMFDDLGQFDAVILNNTTKLKLSDAQRAALLEFVQDGKGLVGIHAATDNFYDWKEGAEMMGGCFAGHPWGGGGTWAIEISEPEHPLNQAFEGKGFLIKDELYKFRDPYSRERLRILVGIDMSNPRNKKGRDDDDNAISWIRELGDGRVFYCSLGHNNHIFWTPPVLKHYLDGIQFALGDLKADATPSAELAEKPTPAGCAE
jgi:type 1 glutamine amidotransferase